MTPVASARRNSASHPHLLGPVCCRGCGYDDGGCLEIVDWYDELRPDYDPPADTLGVWSDDLLYRGSHWLMFCPVCDEAFDPESMVRAEAMA